jgi:hypothetical protein
MTEPLEARPTEPDAPAAESPLAARAHTPFYQGKSILRLVLEVGLISAGVFLGLMAEQWRDRAEQRELARETLRRFRTEMTANRNAVVANRDYHTELKKQIEAFFASEMREQVVMTRSLAPVFFEQAAWDLALATGALSYVNADLAFVISRAYTTQQNYAGFQGMVAQTTIYGRSPAQDPEGFWRSLLWYFGDVTYFDAEIVKAYDAVLQRIDAALGGE